MNPAGGAGLLYEEEITAAGTKRKHYLSAGEVSVGAVVCMSGSACTATQAQYWHGDAQGSVTAVTGAGGAVTELMDYEPFGKRRYPGGPTDQANTLTAATDRGYTGHEHLDEVGLINMNGRVYDPSLSRFMSADPYVTFPGDMQSYNRYSYVLNQPFAWTDPTGYEPWSTTTDSNGDTTRTQSSTVGGGSASNSYTGDYHSCSSCSSSSGRGSYGVAPAKVDSSKITSTYSSVVGAWYNVPGALQFSGNAAFVGAALWHNENSYRLGLFASGFKVGFRPDSSYSDLSFGQFQIPLVLTGFDFGQWVGNIRGAFEYGPGSFAAGPLGATAKVGAFWTKATEFQGVRIYLRNDLIDATLVDARGRSNLQRMKSGLAPIGPDGKSMNLHHMVQSADSPLAEMTATFHQVNSKVIHINPSTIRSGIDREAFDAYRRDYWINRAKDF